MSSGAEEKLAAALEECALHARILEEDLAEHGEVSYDAETVTRMDRASLRLLDQMAYRFSKLQDAMGQKVLPLLLERAEEPLPPDATFATKLQRLERLGFIPSAEQWRQLREARNALAHEYPDAPEISAARINQFVADVGDLLAFWRHVRNYGP